TASARPIPPAISSINPGPFKSAAVWGQRGSFGRTRGSVAPAQPCAAPEFVELGVGHGVAVLLVEAATGIDEVVGEPTLAAGKGEAGHHAVPDFAVAGEGEGDGAVPGGIGCGVLQLQGPRAVIGLAVGVAAERAQIAILAQESEARMA